MPCTDLEALTEPTGAGYTINGTSSSRRWSAAPGKTSGPCEGRPRQPPPGATSPIIIAHYNYAAPNDPADNSANPNAK